MTHSLVGISNDLHERLARAERQALDAQAHLVDLPTISGLKRQKDALRRSDRALFEDRRGESFLRSEYLKVGEEIGAINRALACLAQAGAP